MFDAIGEGHKIMQRSISNDEALRQAYAADPMQAVIDLHELARKANELEDKVRELEKEKEQLLGVIGSMHSIMKQRNNMAVNLVTILHDAMNKQFLNAMDESLTQAFALIQEALDARP